MTGLSRRSRYALQPRDRDAAQAARAQHVAARYMHANNGNNVSSSGGGGADYAAAAATTTYRLSPADSAVAAQKEHDAARWRSDLLHCEADLRELVTRGTSSPPSLARIVRVLQLYDGVCSIAAGHSHTLAELLRLFRGEFCHAIFVDTHDDEDKDDDEDDGASTSSMQHMQTYFDQVGSLLRETALLTAQTAQTSARDAVDELQRQLARSAEAVKMYESEVGRLTRQHDSTTEQLRRAREELATYRAQSEAALEAVERELRARNIENKDMQLQLFRLRKQVAGGKAKLLKDSYRQLKRSKMQLMTTLFDEGDERVALLVLLSQLESRLNETLDAYDNEFVLTSDAAHGELRRKMCEAAAVLLEEMHLCESQYRRLVRRGRGGDGEAPHGAAVAASCDRGTEMGGAAVALTSATAAAAGSNSSNSKGGGVGEDSEAAALDETDGFVAAMFDMRIYERLRVRAALQPTWLQQEEAALQTSSEAATSTAPLAAASSTTTPPTSSLAATATPAAAAASSLTQPPGLSSAAASTTTTTTTTTTYEQRQHQWIERVFDVAVRGGDGVAGEGKLDEKNNSNNSSSGSHHHHHHHLQLQPSRGGGALVVPSSVTMSADALLPRLLTHPMRDLDSARFCAGVDLYSGSDAVQQEYVCSVRYADAVGAVAVPEATRYVKLRQMSSIVGDARRTRARRVHRDKDVYGDEDVYGDGDADDDGDEYDDRTDGGSSSGGGGGGRRRHNSNGAVAADAAATLPYRHGGTHAVTAARQLAEWGAPLSRVVVAGRGGSGKQGEPALQRRRRAHGATATTATTTVAAGAAAAGSSNNNKDLVHSSASDDSDDSDAATRTQRGHGQQCRRPRHQHTRGGGGGVFCAHPQLRAFDELGKAALLRDSGNAPTLQRSRAAATSSTTAATVALQRLDPASPNRGPEWALYKALFGRHRSLAPRMLEVTTIDHVLRAACGRHFARMQHRYAQCTHAARPRSTNSVMARAMAERLFRDAYELSDFQEALVDELEARYGLPELVAKNLYEMLCYLDAMASKDALLHLYLSVVRGFAPATHIHYICHMLYLLSHSWPSANPTSEVAREDALTVLRFLYKDAEAVVHVDVHAVMKDFDMATRAAPLTLVTMREYLSTAMLHQEEPVLLYLNGLFSTQCVCESVAEVTYDAYATVVHKYWHEKGSEDKGLVRYLATGLGLNRGALLSTRDLACVAASMWCSDLWH